MNKMPAGKYYVGDLCYVMHDVWNEFCNITIEGNNVLDGVFALSDGRLFATFCTMYGDGEYRDNYGRMYGVDAGLIGCIRVEDIKDPEAHMSGGHVIEFKEDFEVDSVDGEIMFGDIYINTAGEEEEDYYEEEEAF